MVSRMPGGAQRAPPPSPLVVCRGLGRRAAAHRPTPRCERRRQGRPPRCYRCWARCRPGGPAAASCCCRCQRGRSTGAAASGSVGSVAGGWLEACMAGRRASTCAAHMIAAALHGAVTLRAVRQHAQTRQPPGASRHRRARACCWAPAGALTSASSGPICARHSTAASLLGRRAGLQGGQERRAAVAEQHGRLRVMGCASSGAGSALGTMHSPGCSGGGEGDGSLGALKHLAMGGAGSSPAAALRLGPARCRHGCN